MNKLLWPKLFAVITLVGIVALSGRPVYLRHYRIPWQNQYVIPTSNAVKALTEKSDLVVSNSVPVLYYSDRQGFTVPFPSGLNGIIPEDSVIEIDVARKQGAKYLVITIPESMEIFPQLVDFLSGLELLAEKEGQYKIYQL